jgi:hypothetical protein
MIATSIIALFVFENDSTMLKLAVCERAGIS